jgi:23S rRNA (adenine1618-N6)-methyltransferase
LEYQKYDFDELGICHKPLQKYIVMNDRGATTIDWSDAMALQTLNQAILKKYYHIAHWSIPENTLCPAIPSRQAYLDWIANLLKINRPLLAPSQPIKGLDIGTGASLIYPILGVQKYQYTFVATDIDKLSLENCQRLIDLNGLQRKIELKL